MSDNALTHVLTDQPPSTSLATTGSTATSSAPSFAGPNTTEQAYGDQELWQERVAIARLTAMRMIAAGISFGDILKFLATLRKQTAQDQNTDDAHEFGKTRLPWRDAVLRDEGENAKYFIRHHEELHGQDADIFYGVKTPMVERYTEAARKARAALTSGATNLDGSDFETLTVRGELAATPETPELSGQELTGYRSLGRIGGETIPLTGSVFVEADGTESAPKTLGAWMHTPPEHIPKILAHVGELHAGLFPTVIDERGIYRASPSGLDEETCVARVGEMAWWLCHATPYMRGSASIIEWYIESVLDQSHISLGKSKEMIDLAAFRMSKDDFVRHFRTFFDGNAGSAKGATEQSNDQTDADGDTLALYEREVRATELLFRNNCLINAISLASRGNNASLAELIDIRSQLGNIGEMLVASPATIAVICAALGVTRPIVVNYPLPMPPENFPGTGANVVIRHTGVAHFEAQCS